MRPVTPFRRAVFPPDVERVLDDIAFGPVPTGGAVPEDLIRRTVREGMWPAIEAAEQQADALLRDVLDADAPGDGPG